VGGGDEGGDREHRGGEVDGAGTGLLAATLNLQFVFLA
jgi:hypothetical protein